MKRNRRYGVIFQGKKKDPELVLTLLLDESGSVDDAQFTQFWAEMEKIYPQVAELNIINFDAKVNKVYTYKKGMKIVRTGQGGTLFAPAFEEAKKLKSDAVIVFTDGYPCDEVSKPKFPVLWASTQRDERPFDWGKFVKVPVVEEK
jgi:predicted metal-dependent peptidase